MGDEARLLDRPPLVYGHSARCLNCDAPISGAFCSACGQRDVPPYPSVRELAADAVAEFSGWDGRLASSLRALVQRPGYLTHEFLEGRRVRYISPLRLYVMASVVYFLIAAAAPSFRTKTGEVAFGGMSVGVSTTTTSSGPLKAPQRVAKAADESLKGGQPMTAAERDAALKDISHAPGILQPLLRRVVIDPVGFKRGLRETMPRMLFVLLPVFAGIVALFYRGRKYPEHLYFAIHLHAFAFLALAAMELLKFSRISALVAAGATAALIAIPVYSTIAFRRVYGGSVAGTIGKEVGIGLLYALVSGVAFILMIYWVSLAA
jgi:hypothetical protein